MGTTQCKCECGTYSKVKIMTKYATEGGLMNFVENFEKIKDASDCKYWELHNVRFEILLCDQCSYKLMKKFDDQEIEYETLRSDKGWFKTALP